MSPANTAILKLRAGGSRPVKVALVRFPVPDEIALEARRRAVAEQHPDAVLRRIVDSIKPQEVNDDAAGT